MTDTYGDCRTEEGITTGLIDAIITAARVLARRDLAPVAVREALADLRSDEDLAALLVAEPVCGERFGRTGVCDMPKGHPPIAPPDWLHSETIRPLTALRGDTHG